jgi:lysophospholipase L1-like esterase
MGRHTARTSEWTDDTAVPTIDGTSPGSEDEVRSCSRRRRSSRPGRAAKSSPSSAAMSFISPAFTAVVSTSKTARTSRSASSLVTVVSSATRATNSMGRIGRVAPLTGTRSRTDFGSCARRSRVSSAEATSLSTVRVAIRTWRGLSGRARVGTTTTTPFVAPSTTSAERPGRGTDRYAVPPGRGRRLGDEMARHARRRAVAALGIGTAVLLTPLLTTDAPAGAGTLTTCATAVCVSAGDATVVEGDSGTRSISFPVVLSRPATAAVTMKYRLENDTATGAAKITAGVDFVDKGTALQTLSFPLTASGVTAVMKRITVTVAGDTVSEAPETIRLALSTLSGPARLRRPFAVGTILDDDGGSGIHAAIGDAAVVEGDSGKTRSLQFPVTLSAPSTSAVNLPYVVTPGSATRSSTATGGGDYGGAASGTVKFPVTASGKTATQKTITLPVWADTSLEPDDTLSVTISGPLPSGVTIGRNVGNGTIVDDDGTGTSVAPPSSMAGLGDSISRGYNACSTFGECTSAVWSTGSDAGVDSHYTRILALNPAIAGHAFNDAVSGATMSNLDGQATSAVGQHVEYVTIEMGGNDVCKPTEAQMTSVATYQAQFQQAMTTLTTGLPDAHILVASVPDVLRLWEVGKDVAAARAAWSNFAICPTITANPQSTAPADVDRRQRVHQRVIDYNTALATVCAQYTNCRFDGNAVFNSHFALSDVSTADYFHPSYAGQTGLAILTYAAGYDW